MIWQELGPFTVFDLETTGLSPSRDRIVEIAAIRVEPDGSLSNFQTLIDPERPIPRAVSAIHGICDRDVCGAPRFADTAARFMALAEGSTLVAHNAMFDLGFLQESLARCGMELWRGKTLDSLRLIRGTHPGLSSYRLQYLRSYFQLDSEEDMQAHRALADASWTVQILGIALNAALEKASRQN